MKTLPLLGMDIKAKARRDQSHGVWAARSYCLPEEPEPDGKDPDAEPLPC